MPYWKRANFRQFSAEQLDKGKKENFKKASGLFSQEELF